MLVTEIHKMTQLAEKQYSQGVLRTLTPQDGPQLTPPYVQVDITNASMCERQE